MAAITMRNIVKKYGDGYPAVNDVSLDIADGEFMILVGPSGCGKSTLLRMIVGLEDITSGDMLIGDKRVNDKAPRDRNLSMVFQNYALYPHLSVFENIAFPLRLSGKFSDEEIRKRVTEAADTLELGEHLDRGVAGVRAGAAGRAVDEEQPDAAQVVPRWRLVPLLLTVLGRDRLEGGDAQVDEVVPTSPVEDALRDAGQKAPHTRIVAEFLKERGVSSVVVSSSLSFLKAKKLREQGVEVDCREDPFFPERLVKSDDEI
ncbi:ABC transporter ATP-binding protein, partial [Mycolicibacterium poriferae]|uniref:ABC transporter ATP-binding protein n=1 Tax=Mycolicibacterium poriferae TaxID=39694 RepID=UPI00321C0EFC